MENEFVYYSSCETFANGAPAQYILHKCYKKGKNITTIVGFHHIRGIERDASSNTYVVDSLNSRILKFDSEFNLIYKTCSISEPFGILVRNNRVYICDNRKNKITILNDSLDLCFDIKRTDLLIDPTDITELDGTLFVTTYTAIVAIDVDFDTKSFEARKIKKMVKDGKMESFNEDNELRGICADSEYLYVTESKGRLLRLKYDRESGQLNFTGELKDCSPVVVACHNEVIYFSRIAQDGRCYISKLAINSHGELSGYEDLFRA